MGKDMAAIECGCGAIYSAGGFHAKIMVLDTRSYCERCRTKEELGELLGKYVKDEKLQECVSDVYLYYLVNG